VKWVLLDRVDEADRIRVKEKSVLEENFNDSETFP
jgi:hypothetical protein